MRKKSNRKKVSVGDLYAIQIEPGEYAFSLVCEGNDFAFFNYKSCSQSLPEGILNKPVAFRLPVIEGEQKSSGWTCIGSLEVSGKFALPEKYLHKPVGSKDVFIYQNGESIPAEKSEIEGLEVLSAWYAFHIEERLRDFFREKKTNM